MQWNLIGPFNNYGSFDSAFWPELPGCSPLDSAGITATGGTIWLWHTHSPKVKAWASATENTTWYAYTQFGAIVAERFLLA